MEKSHSFGAGKIHLELETGHLLVAISYIFSMLSPNFALLFFEFYYFSSLWPHQVGQNTKNIGKSANYTNGENGSEN